MWPAVWTQCRHQYSLWYVCGLLCGRNVDINIPCGTYVACCACLQCISVCFTLFQGIIPTGTFPHGVCFLPSVQFCVLRECVRHLQRFALLLLFVVVVVVLFCFVDFFFLGPFT